MRSRRAVSVRFAVFAVAAAVGVAGTVSSLGVAPAQADPAPLGPDDAVALQRTLAPDAEFAGVYLDDAQRLTVATTGSRLAAEAREDGARVVRVGHSLADLESAQRRLESSLGDQASAVVDISENNLHVYAPAAGLDAAGRVAVVARRAAGVEVVVHEVDLKPAVWKPILRGATPIVDRTNGVLCTSAFNGVTPGGRLFALTAGHCGPTDSRWRHEDTARHIGIIGRKRFRGIEDDDWAMIKTYTVHRLVPQILDAGVAKDVAGVGSIIEGHWVCRNGRTSGTQCGRITQYARDRAIYTTACALAGDSGGPGYARISGTKRVQALGIVSASTLTCGEPGDISVWQPMPEVLRELDARLLTVPR
ncbi:MAG: hypothetical protein GEU96_12455 [Propionibacteriales bacterium]|nr:hypothetical protein [Propionibacteriales bacterium]